MPDATSATPAATTPAVTPGAAIPSIRSLAVRGVLWTVVGFGGAQVLRLAFNLVLTRLLFPELFGLMALVFTVTTGASLSCDVGSTALVVSHPRGDDPAFLNTVWTVLILRGLALGLVCLLIASPVAAFYGDPRMRWLVPLIGFSLVLDGFNATTLLAARRHMQVKRLVVMELSAQLISGAVMIVGAWVAPGVAPLVAGVLVSTAVKLIWGHFLTPRVPHRLAWDRSTLRVVSTFGRWIWLSTLLAFLATQVDRLILGKMLTLPMLGIYGVALAISEVPRALLGALAGNVVFPAYSKWAALPRAEYRARIRRSRWPLLAAAGAVVAVLTVGGDLVIHTLYDQRYAAAAWMLPLLALGIWPSALYQTIEGSLTTVGEPRYGAFGNLAKTIFTAAGIPLAFAWGGVAGAVVVVALNDLPSYAPIGYGLSRERLHNFGQDAIATALLLLVLAVMILLRILLGFGSPLKGLVW